MVCSHGVSRAKQRVDPFFTIQLRTKHKLHKSETIMNDLNPKWEPFTLTVRGLADVLQQAGLSNVSRFR